MTGARALVELNRAEVADAAPGSVLVLAFGAIEQHGPHLPFGTDFAVVDDVTRRAAARAGEHASVVVAPTLPYGSSDHHLDVGGALSLDPAAFDVCVRALLRSARASGFRRAFLVNGHGGNEQLLRVAAHAAADDKTMVVGGGSYWTLAAPELVGVFDDRAPLPGHAGRFETSLSLALAAPAASPPAREDWTRSPEQPYWLEDRNWWAAIDGYTDSPADGSAAEGMACMEAIVDAVAGCIVEFERSTR